MANPAETPARITLHTLEKLAAEGRPFACLTCYDATTARYLARGGVHLLLVGDTAAEVLSYLEYVPRDLLKRFRALTEDPLTSKRVDEEAAEAIYRNYRRNLKAYTYFSS